MMPIRKFQVVVQATALVLLLTACGDSPSIENPEAAVAAARELMAEYRAHSGRIEYVSSYGGDRLPPALRLLGVQYVIAREDHVNLIMDRNPDTERGLRIWAKGVKHADKPTRYPDIFRYRYCDDEPMSISNQP